MENKAWDRYLQQILGDFTPEGDPLWEDLDARMEGDFPVDSNDPDFPDDESLRASLNAYKPEGEVHGWENIASALDEADRQFDHEVAEKINQYKAPYDPNAWPLFIKHFNSYKALRLKLIALKVFEASAVLLLLFTAYQLNQQGAWPVFNSSDFEQATTYDRSNSEDQISDLVVSTQLEKNNQPFTERASAVVEGDVEELVDLSNLSKRDHTNTEVTSIRQHASVPPIATRPVALSGQSYFDPLANAGGILAVTSDYSPASNQGTQLMTEPLSQVDVELDYASTLLIPDPVYVKPVDQGHLEFGMLALVDHSTLKMPEDILYTHQKQFVFPLQGLPSVGYGAGMTLGVAHDRWAFESGVIYSSKTFKPGRTVTVGEGSDNSQVEFDAMQLQLISVPLQFRYKITPQRRFRMYAIAGLGMHLIAQSDIDVDVNYNFNSLPEGENPNNHPALAQTIRESQRLSEKFRKKAPFSTKSYVSANLGLGVEFALADRKHLFLQTTYQYQIPNLQFSNHNGKHLVTTSLQAGVRTPLSF